MSDTDRKRWTLERNAKLAVRGRVHGCPHALRVDSRLVAWLNDEQADAWEAQQAPAPVDPELPEGVHRAPDGTLLWHALVCSLPEGYEAYRNGCWGQMGHDPRHDWWFAVRPVPSPETERVPLHKLIGRKLPGRSQPVESFNAGPDYIAAWSGSGSNRDEITLDADGCVLVERSDDNR